MGFEVVTAKQNEALQSYAALDLGSNSFHLIIARQSKGQLRLIDRHREMVRLAWGLETTGRIGDNNLQHALRCLSRISQRIRRLPPQNIRIVGTNVLRQAQNSDTFIECASKILSHDIEIISGQEEARLIYLGVSHSLEDDYDSRLVIDIGGGSTEIIHGYRFQPQILASLRMGCVSMTERWFPNRRVSQPLMERAINTARQEIEVIEQIYRRHGWDVAIGSSGTITAVQEVIAKTTGNSKILSHDLDNLVRAVIDCETIDQIGTELVNTGRAEIFPGGIAILSALFQALNIDQMEISNGALREGLLHDILGRVHDADIREQSVNALIERFHIDRTHAERVKDTAMSLLNLCRKDWDIGNGDDINMLKWAATLHELGMDISHSSYHKHGGYLAENLDLPGFSRHEQHILATLIRCHRRKFPTREFDLDMHTAKICVLLRLAVVLRRNRTDDPLVPLSLNPGHKHLLISIPKSWLSVHPLTELDLHQEAAFLKSAPIRLKVEVLN